MFSGLQTETIPPINALEYIISWKRHLTFFLRRCFQQTNPFCQFFFFATWIDEIKQRLSDYHQIRQHWKRHFDKKRENLLLAYEPKFPLGVRTLTFVCLPFAEKRRFLDKICVSNSGSFHLHWEEYIQQLLYTKHKSGKSWYADCFRTYRFHTSFRHFAVKTGCLTFVSLLKIFV